MGVLSDSHELLAGDTIFGKDGRLIAIEAISQRFEPAFPVSNLTIAEFHNYAVGIQSVLVHNTTVCAAAEASFYDMLHSGEITLEEIARHIKHADNADEVLKRLGGSIGGDVHHPISTAVGDALNEHETLKGLYTPRDPRFTTQAINKAAHNGYEDWHIALDKEVVQWLDNNPLVTPDQFESWLRWRYKQSDLRWRFPSGF